jgi:hypothetical protein
MKVNGECHCGAITYEAIIDPEKVAICHCTDCQQLSGTAYRTVVPAPGTGFADVDWISRISPWCTVAT